MATPKRDSISSRFLKRAAAGRKPSGANGGVRRVQIQTNTNDKKGDNHWGNQANDDDKNGQNNINERSVEESNEDAEKTPPPNNSGAQSQRPLPITSTPQPKMSSTDPLSLLMNRRESPDFAAQLDDFGILYEDEPQSLEERALDAVYVRDSLPVRGCTDNDS